jgi:sulfatase maturation enzyme AslB (radical SAM superfamily)
MLSPERSVATSLPDFHPVQAGGLPIFRQDADGYSLVYAPGYLTVVEQAQADWFEKCLATSGADYSVQSAELRRHARAAQRTWDDIATRPFTPLCLTLYLHNKCNLRCTYCFSMASPKAAQCLDITAVHAAADIVAANCRSMNRPFTLVFHGGGEPTFDQHLADRILDTVEQTGAAFGLPMFRYIATNGAMSVSKARWLAQRFDLIGLSCDGPADIQGIQRPMLGGKNSTPLVEQTAQIIHDTGKRLHVRVTVTARSLYRQTEIARYVCEQLQPQEIHVEPVYRIGRAGGADCLGLSQMDDFVAEFLHARDTARRYGVRWLTSGSRPDDIHGAYCNVFRDVLHLVPGNVATACFRTIDAEQAQAVCIGDSAGGHFAVNHDRVQVLRDRLRREPPECSTCFNRYHCTRGCPEYCPLDNTIQPPGFRCQMQQRLVHVYLHEAADTLRASHDYQTGIAGGGITL